METYLNQIMRYLATQSWQIAVLTTTVAAATFALRHRSAHVRYLLWLIVVAKCLVPPVHVAPLRVLPPVLERTRSASPLPARSPDPSPIPSPILPDTLRALHEALSFPVDRGLDSRPSPGTMVLLSPLGRAAAIIWLIGAGSYLVINLLRALRGHCSLRKTRKSLANGVQADTTCLLGAYGARRLPRVYLVDGVSQPFVWGLIRGSIYIPPSFLSMESPEHRRDILAHELSHILRFDAAVNAIQIIAQSLFWFHPLVWWANRKVRQEREKCCDEMVIARLHTTPKDYSTAIVETLARAKESGWSVPSLAVASPLKHVEGRIRTVLRPGKRFHARPSLPVVTLVILAALAAVSTTLVVTALGMEPIALPMPLSEFPRTLNGWTGEDMSLPTAVQDYMRANLADDFINRRCVNRTTQQWADLHVVYCSSRPSAIMGHRPEVCFPANGWIHDGTETSQITSCSGRPIDCSIHRFRKPSPQPLEVTVLCFYLVNGRISVNEQDFSNPSARRLNVSGNPARYVAQVEISSVLEHSVRSAASALADAILDSLPDPNGRVPARRSTAAPLAPGADQRDPSIHEEGIGGRASAQPRLAARTFNSEVPFDVFVQETCDSIFDRGYLGSPARCIGRTPSPTSLEIPACSIWWVEPLGPVTDWDLLAQEMSRSNIPALRLSRAADSDVRPLTGLTGLKYLDLSYTQVTDTGLAELKGLTGLQGLGLMGTKITDAGLTHIKDLTGLRELILSRTGITDAGLAELKGLTGLRRLDVSRNRITDAGLIALEGMAGLQFLDLNGTGTTDAGLAHVQGLTRLQHLLLQGLRITDAGLTYLKDLTELRRLECSEAPITDAGLTPLEGLNRLQVLLLVRAEVTGPGLEYLKGMTGLQVLILQECPITNTGLELLKDLIGLRQLYLSHTEITDAGLPHLTKLVGLEQLDLSHTAITDASLDHLKDLTRLGYLNLRDTQITDAGLKHLQGLTELRYLGHSGSQITDAGMQQLRRSLPTYLGTD